MSKKKKKKQAQTLEKLVLATAIINCIYSLIELIKALID